MGLRNYYAFIRTVRKTKGLSLPSAIRVYRKVKARLGRQPRGVDVKKHPRILRESLSVRDRKRLGFTAKSKKVRKPVLRRVVPEGPKRERARDKGPAKKVRKPKLKPMMDGGLLPTEHEYAASSDYNGLRVQVHVQSHLVLTHKQIGAAVDAWMRRESSPDIKVFAIEWANGINRDFTKETNSERIKRVREDFRKIGMEFS